MISTSGLLLILVFFNSTMSPFIDIRFGILLPISILIMGYSAVIVGRILVARKIKEDTPSDSSEADRTLGLFYLQQGMLDLAFEKFRPLAKENEVKDMLYGLGLEYEKKGHMQKALVAYKVMIGEDKYTDDFDISIFQTEESESSRLVCEQEAGRPDMPVDATSKLVFGGGYEVSGEIGQDAMGAICKAKDLKTSNFVTIKSVHLSRFDEAQLSEIREHFFREMECLRLLIHPNIVTVFNWGEEQNLFYLAMEYLEGETLEQYTKKGKLLPIMETIKIISMAADALDFAHRKSVYHLHIKPASLMLMKKNRVVKFLDFGTAWLTSAFTVKPDSLKDAHFYLSPEQIVGKKVDGRSDIFSLGVMFFEMLTGEKPFTGEDLSSIILLISNEKHPSVRSHIPKIPQVIEKIIDRALEKDLKKRYQTAGQMAVHLKTVLSSINKLIDRKRSESSSSGGARS